MVSYLGHQYKQKSSPRQCITFTNAYDEFVESCQHRANATQFSVKTGKNYNLCPIIMFLDIKQPDFISFSSSSLRGMLTICYQKFHRRLSLKQLLKECITVNVHFHFLKSSRYRYLYVCTCVLYVNVYLVISRYQPIFGKPWLFGQILYDWAWLQLFIETGGYIIYRWLYNIYMKDVYLSLK